MGAVPSRGGRCMSPSRRLNGSNSERLLSWKAEQEQQAQVLAQAQYSPPHQLQRQQLLEGAAFCRPGSELC